MSRVTVQLTTLLLSAACSSCSSIDLSGLDSSSFIVGRWTSVSDFGGSKIEVRAGADYIVYATMQWIQPDNSLAPSRFKGMWSIGAQEAAIIDAECDDTNCEAGAIKWTCAQKNADLISCQPSAGGDPFLFTRD